MKNIKVKLIVLFLGFFLKGYGYINIYPYRVYLDVEKKLKSEEIVLYNKTSMPLRYKFSIKDEELKKIVSFYPQVITINSGEEKSVKLKLEENREAFIPKEYSTDILIEQLKVPLKNIKGEFIQSVGVEIYPKLKIPLKVYLGDRDITLKNDREKILKNISGRELNFEIFHKKIKKDKKNPLGFIKSIRLKDGEEIDISDYIEKYIKDNKVKEKINIKNLEIYEKVSNRVVKII